MNTPSRTPTPVFHCDCELPPVNFCIAAGSPLPTMALSEMAGGGSRPRWRVVVAARVPADTDAMWWLQPSAPPTQMS